MCTLRIVDCPSTLLLARYWADSRMVRQVCSMTHLAHLQISWRPNVTAHKLNTGTYSRRKPVKVFVRIRLHIWKYFYELQSSPATVHHAAFTTGVFAASYITNLSEASRFQHALVMSSLKAQRSWALDTATVHASRTSFIRALAWQC